MKRKHLSGGLFISFEGVEGSGKTTQINRLSNYLKKEGYSVTTTREPGGTAEGESIRNVLVQRDGGNWLPMSEVLLLYAARYMHVEKVIKPALADGKIVISDRFADSTLAYQGYGHRLNYDSIMAVNALILGEFKPDLTYILDIDVKIGIERSNKQLATQKGYSKTEDRFERMDIKFHKRVRQGFLDIAKSDMERCRVINANEDIDTLSNTIKDSVSFALNKRSIVEEFAYSQEKDKK